MITAAVLMIVATGWDWTDPEHPGGAILYSRYSCTVTYEFLRFSSFYYYNLIPCLVT
jgi:hypothetical protein